MNIASLKARLTEIGYRLGASNICGEGAPEGLMIKRDANLVKDFDVNWVVGFMERGELFDEVRYFEEAKACEDFFSRAKKDLDSKQDYYSIKFVPKYL